MKPSSCESRTANRPISITVFGNELEPKDSLAVQLVPTLQKKFPDIGFVISDPTESLEPMGNPWIILDVAQDINDITIITDLKDLDQVPGSSAHDYDVYLDLRLKEKLGELPPLKLILVPNTWTPAHALVHLSEVISTLI
jgi:hypothetical protein